MEKSEYLEVECPCCQRALHVDVETGAAEAIPKQRGSLDDALKKAGTSRSDAAALFGDALGAERRRKAELEEKFKKATDKAADDETDDAPDNPLDDRWR